MTITTTTQKPRLNGRLLREARSARGSLALNLGLQVLLGIVIVAQALLLSRIIYAAFHLGTDLDELSPTLALLAGVVLARAALTYGSAVTAAEIAITVKASLRRQFVERLYALGPAFTRTERSGELVLSATDGVDKLDGYYRDYLPGVFTALFLPVIILLFVLPVDLLTFVVLLVTAPLIPFFMALIGMAAGVLAKRQHFEMQTLGAHFLDVMQGLITLKLFNRSRYQVETIRRMTDEFRVATMRVLRVAFLSAFTLEMLATLSVAIVAVEVGIRLLHGGIGFEAALFLLVVAPEFYLPLRALGAKFHNATEGKAAAERLYAVLDRATEAETPPDGHRPDAMNLQFDGVTFVYEPGEAAALDDVSFEVRAGQKVALVGASGSGKTTVARLLLKFAKPTGGRILVDGVDLNEVAAEAWRESIAWVGQAPYLFNTSVAENIRLGRPEASDEEVATAAALAQADGFIRELPDGYATRCGEQGLRLSGGQAQRIALARALLRNAPLLILDEPTSQLDPVSEAALMANVMARANGQTVLLIAHRLSTVEHADLIVVMAGGRVVEQGTHEALLSAGGAYARLVAADGGMTDDA